MTIRGSVTVLLFAPLSVFADIAPFPVPSPACRAIDVYLYVPMVAIIIVLGVVSTFVLRNMRKTGAGGRPMDERQEDA